MLTYLSLCVDVGANLYGIITACLEKLVVYFTENVTDFENSSDNKRISNLHSIAWQLLYSLVSTTNSMAFVFPQHKNLFRSSSSEQTMFCGLRYTNARTIDITINSYCLHVISCFFQLFGDVSIN